ncbi:MAG: ABC transporter permease [Gemmatimonadetes bacterium]|nr:ABC transporter permease [Gemmatimonadota bacterium]
MLLRLAPRGFREDFGAEVIATVSDRRGDLGPHPSATARLRFWWKEARALGRAAIRERSASRVKPSREHLMEGLSKDIRHSLRALIKRPGFTAIATLTLGLGIGATTAMFSAIHGVLLTDLPYSDPDQIVTLYQIDTQDGQRSEGVSAANVRDVRESADLFVQVAVADPWSHDLMRDGRAVSLRSWAVSEGFFEAIGAQPALGRVFLTEEYLQDSEPVVMMGHATWQSRFGGDPSVVGSTVVLDGAERTVVGVLPPGFKFPAPAELWSPRPFQPWDDRSRAAAYMAGVARMALGVTVDQAQSQLDRISAELGATYPRSNGNKTIQALPIREFLFGDIRTPLLVLMGAVALVLLVAAANVAGLQLARGAGRAREYALRGALGASSSRLLRLVTVESTLLAGMGCALGILLAWGGTHVIRALAPTGIPRIDEVSLDLPVLGFAMAAALVSALCAGIFPALKASGTDLNGALSEGGRGTEHGRRSGRLRDRLVVGEIALALVLTIGAGLLFKSFDRLLSKELGMEPDGRLAMQLFAYDNEGQMKTDFVRESMEQIRALPGVEAVAVSSNIPLADDQSISSIEITVPFKVDDADAPPEGQEPTANVASITAGYPEAMGIRLVAGREFSAEDHAEAPATILINEALARRHFADRSPLGRSLSVSYNGWTSRTIVGVLADVRPQGFESEPVPEIYMPLDQVPTGSLTYVIKTGGDPASIAPTVQRAVWDIDPTQSIWATRTVPDLLSDWIRERRFNLALMTAFSGLAILLAAIGVYGLMSFSVEQRVGELGLRRALGGESKDLLRMVLGKGAVLAAMGIGIGLVGAIATTRLLQGMLYEVGPFDPGTFAALSITVLLVTVVAAYIPARRATRVDPMVALRTE